MEIAEILHQLERATGKFPRAAVEAAVACREQIIPELLRILQDVVDRAAQLDAEGDYMAHLYAMFLLAQCGQAIFSFSCRTMVKVSEKAFLQSRQKNS